ncbi:MAG: hypothetical protein KGZ41_05050 [Dethiobacter sp.]|nr:hypothetical protein [Dethiobacter sp.]MBS3983146.1 hypothetical protein [Dethiobacter sp.]MCL4462322.1 hypothetical protein [Bacillota bacterium]
MSDAEENGVKVNKEEKAGETVSKQLKLDVKRGNRIMSMEFDTEEDRRGWERAYRKSRLYTLYFMVGVGINFIFYFAGLDLSRNLLLGGVMGLAVPVAAMLGFTELHLYFLEQKNMRRR